MNINKGMMRRDAISDDFTMTVLTCTREDFQIWSNLVYSSLPSQGQQQQISQLTQIILRLHLHIDTFSMLTLKIYNALY